MEDTNRSTIYIRTYFLLLRQEYVSYTRSLEAWKHGGPMPRSDSMIMADLMPMADPMPTTDPIPMADPIPMVDPLPMANPYTWESL